MSTQTGTIIGAAPIERVTALTTSIAPVMTGVMTPMLDTNATFVATIAYGCVIGITGTNYMNRISDNLLNNLPGGDIIKAHKSPLFISTLTSGMALAMGALGGAAGSDALLAGFLAPGDSPAMAFVSLAWWGAVGLVPWKLRTVIKGRKPTKSRITQGPTPGREGPSGNGNEIYARWARLISGPKGPHHGRELSGLTITDKRWRGIITAPEGMEARLTPEIVSAAYRVDPDWVTIEPGRHTGEQTITVLTVAPPADQATGLAALWRKRIGRSGGLMPHTHLEDLQADPNTGGQAGYVVAGEDLTHLTAPDRTALAGALRTSPLLVSYEPIPSDPRKAIIRVMDENPLEKGNPLTSRETLRATKGGRVPLGKAISGFPSYLSLFDPTLGAMHLMIMGATGAGKGGAVQLVALGYHVNGAAIIYADPKGSSNPAVEKMSAYAGTGLDGSIKALRVAYAILQHRIAESAELGLKNFKPTKDRPWVPVILDEANQVLGPNSPHRKEAVKIVAALTSLGRSMGMPFVLVNQSANLDQIGGEAAIRLNLINGGAWLILRTDSSQTNLADLPPGFDGIDPSQVPAVWTQEQALVYDPDMDENDPRRTFGLGYLAAAGGRPEMFRTWILEDAAEAGMIVQDDILIPADFPDWEDREGIACTSIFGGDGEEGEGGEGWSPSPASETRKELTVPEKVIKVMEGETEMALDDEVVYTSVALIKAGTGAAESSVNTALRGLCEKGLIHKGPQRGTYGLGPAPEDIDEAA
ncbi:hypothetical protein ABT282_31120 [Streptomyces sp. NPDC000927]|uniref:hypothetical protein n=1 Tax=Streptomyces sp. NPDC000927 TaxID=3154371 RepID=UPI00331B757A